MGHQMGSSGNIKPTGQLENFAAVGGDLLRAHFDGTSFVLENNGTAGAISTMGAGNGQGIGGGEFYFGDHLGGSNTNGASTSDGHFETLMGGLAFLPGSNEVITTSGDVLTYNSGGLAKFSNITGDKTAGFDLYSSTYGGVQEKSNGLGDIEIICDAAPIQIGNYVWLDTDQDGVQDPNEAPITNVIVTLWKGATQIASTTTNAKGEYYFSAKSVLGAAWTGTGADTSLVPNTAYTVKIQKNTQASISSLQLTTTNATANSGNDQTDNDAVMNGNFAQIDLITGNAGSVNHTYDFGFSSCAKPTISISIVQPSCTNGLPNDDGTISLTAVTNADKYGVSSGSTYTGPAYASANPVGAMPHVLQDSIPNTGGAYTFRMFNGSEACYLDTTFQITGFDPKLTGRDTAICLSNTLNLANLFTQDTSAGAISYYISYSNAQANTNALGSSVVAPTATAPYFVRKTLSNGCFVIDTLGVTVMSASVSIADTMVCGNATALLDAGTHTAYLWSTGETSQTITKPAGVYTITVTDPNGCTATASGTIIASPVPTVTINDTEICSGTSVTITATTLETNILWSTTQTTSSITVMPSANTTYAATVTNAAGCTATDSGVVSVVQKPQAGNDQSLACTLSVMQTSASLGVSGNWSVVSQPAGANAAVTGAGAVSNMLIAGDYVFRLTNTGTTITCTDDVKITVAACNSCPTNVCYPITVSKN